VTDTRKLIQQLAAQEAALQATCFLAPCVRGGRVRTRVAGLLATFAARPAEFEGWGIFQPMDAATAAVVEEASLPEVAEYLRLLPPLRLRLALALQGQTWLAYPVNESDARQRWGAANPVPVHLVTDGVRFEQIMARWDGGAWWFEDVDRRADPRDAEQLQEALRQVTPQEALSFKGLTPEMRAVYDLAAQHAQAFQAQRQQRRDEARLREALRLGGGTLREFRERRDHWLLEWTTADGERHTSAISKNDLTVLSAGICLSGEDRKFDLQSLVGVIERREE